MRFIGQLCEVDTPSRTDVRGARGHRVIITRTAAESALGSLFSASLRMEHDGRLIGGIHRAWFDKQSLMVAGHAVEQVPVGAGLSWEMEDYHIEDMRSEVWALNKITFMGVAIISDAEKAAYSGTWVRELSFDSKEMSDG